MVYDNVSPAYLPSLRGPRDHFRIRCDSYVGGIVTTPKQWRDKGLPVVAGVVTDDATSLIRRSVELVIADPALSVTSVQDLLAPYGAELRITVGHSYPDGSYDMIPQGVFLITDTDTTTTGSEGAQGLRVVGEDRARYIVDATFPGPRRPVGNTVADEIRTLVADAMPAINLGPMADETGDNTPMSQATYNDLDRARNIVNLMKSINAELIFRVGDGAPVLRPEPELTATTPAVWLVNEGPDGVKTAGQHGLSRGNLYNGILVVGERADGTEAASYFAIDNNSNSPTMWGGLFGQKPAPEFRSPFLRTVGSCQQRGEKIIRSWSGQGWTLSVDSAPNYALQSGDCIQVQHNDGKVRRHLISRVTIPLTVDTAQSIDTRSNIYTEGDV